MYRTAGIAAAALLVALRVAPTGAVALTPQEIATACDGAEGIAHCGRRVEEVQLKRLPGLATREGDVLRVSLYPDGQTSFTDTVAPNGGRSYALWDYLDRVNMAVIYATQGDDASFVLLQRTTGRTFEVPAEPKLAPDRQRLATADFCTQGCSNAVAVWRITRDAVRKEATWTPPERWSDGSVRWKSADTLEIEYSRPGESASHTIERRLDEPGWGRIAQP